MQGRGSCPQGHGPHNSVQYVMRYRQRCDIYTQGPNHHHQARTGLCRPFAWPSGRVLAVDMDVDGAGTKRRREGCARCFGTSGKPSYDGLRARKTASSRERPGVLTELELQGGAVMVGYVDDAALSFLLKQSLAVECTMLVLLVFSLSWHVTVAVHQRGHQHPCRGAKAFSHGPRLLCGPSRFISCSKTWWSMPLVCMVQVPGYHLPCRGVEAPSHGPDCAADHRDPICTHTRWSMPLLSGSCMFSGRASSTGAGADDSRDPTVEAR